MSIKIEKYKNGEISGKKLSDIFKGWGAYSKWGNNYNLTKKFNKEFSL